jgi:hypothetical protein
VEVGAVGADGGSWAIVLIVDDGVELVIAEVPTRPPDLAVVDRLARLQLAARRLGCQIGVRDAGVDLRGLLDLVGLADVLGCPSALGEAGQALEPGGQAEGREQLGVQEVVEPHDLAP